MMRRKIGASALALPLVASLATGDARSAEPQRGVIRTVEGQCLIVRAGADAPLPAYAQGFVVAGDTISCQVDSQLSFSLPGSGRLQEVPRGGSQMVPATPRLPEPPAGRGKLGGRTAQAVTTCESPLGTLVVSEDPSANATDALRAQYQLPPPSELLRVMVRDSNCFVIVERRRVTGGNAMLGERPLVQSGEMRRSSNFGVPMGVATDFSLTPSLTASPPDQAAVAAVAGALAGHMAGLSGKRIAIAGAAVDTAMPPVRATLMLVDNRAGTIMSSSEAPTRAMELSQAVQAPYGSASGAAGASWATPQGRALSASYVDAFNQMVTTLKASRGLPPPVEPPKTPMPTGDRDSKPAEKPQAP